MRSISTVESHQKPTGRPRRLSEKKLREVVSTHQTSLRIGSLMKPFADSSRRQSTSLRMKASRTAFLWGESSCRALWSMELLLLLARLFARLPPPPPEELEREVTLASRLAMAAWW